jgi:hypothetical protein
MLRAVRTGVAALVCAFAAAASAQHALPEQRPRPLHQRLAASDAVAFATIAGADLGRVRAAEVISLRGELASELELKRAPSAPLPLAAGQHALLLLRGGRSPYLLVDRADELWTGDGEADWQDAVRALDAERADPTQVAARYAEWLEGGRTPLARWAAEGFEGDAALFAHAPAKAPERLAALALDSPDAALRDAAARAAAKNEAALARLLAGLPGGAADPAVTAHALLAGLTRADGRAAALRCLAHPSSAVRGAALRFGTLLAGDPALHAQLQRMASEDPDEQLRLAARRALTAR